MPSVTSAGDTTTQQAGPGPPVERTRDLYVAVALLAGALGIANLVQRWDPNKWMHGDGAFYMNVVRGVVEHGTLEQSRMHPHSWYDRPMGWNHTVDIAWSNVAVGRNGTWWPKHNVLMPLCAVPFYLAFGAMGTLVFNFVAYLSIPLLALKIALKFVPRPAALASVALLSAMPFFNEQTWTFSNDNFYTVLLLFAVDAVIDGRAEACGVAFGLAVFAKPTNALYGPALLSLLLLRRQWRPALRFCGFAAGPIVVYLALNAYMFGSPFTTGYERALVVANGQKQIDTHAKDFAFANTWPATKNLLFGPAGIGRLFPVAIAAIPGLVVLALRRPREALVFAWCLAVPLAFHSTFRWYRMQFNLPQLALAIAPAAALIPPFAVPTAPPSPPGRVRWGRLVPVATAVILVVCGLVRVALPKEGGRFHQRVPEAAVFLGEIPCDYYNNQMERWECSHFDNDWLMTGRVLGRPLEFGGKKRKLVLLHPHTNGQVRSIEYPDTALSGSLRLEYGLSDASRAACDVTFTVSVDGQKIHDDHATAPGLKEVTLPTDAWSGRRATVRFTSQARGDANGCQFVFDGGPA